MAKKETDSAAKKLLNPIKKGKVKMVKVEFIKIPAQFNLCWHIGQTAMIAEPLANEIVEAKVGVIVDE